LDYRWKFRQKPDENTLDQLVSNLNVPKSLANVLMARGVKSVDEAVKFFKPELSELNPPLLMDGMDLAIERILRAISEKEAIWIHGDYDVDGTTSTAMLLQFLREIGATAEYYIPDRFIEGYGFSISSVNKAIAKGTTLIITVDVGITSFEPLEYAKKNNIDVIVCDHHEPGTQIPDAYLILDPMRPECNYPFKSLSACGVTYKLVQGISDAIGQPEKALEYLDFVVIASAADMVPLVGENRTLSYYGLELLNTKPRPGFKGLFYCTGLKQGSITTSSIVYAIAPLINAAGRVGDAKRAVEMMIQKDEISAFQIAQQLEQENRRRRIFDEQTFEEAIPMAEAYLQKTKARALVLHSPNWHAGVIGIVASRLVDRFHLPTILLTTIEGLAKGSARSINTFDIHNALKTTHELLVEYGGHKHAAGLSLEVANLPEFRERIEKLAEKTISTEMLTPEIVIDSELQFNELSPNFLDILNKFAPFGYDNYRPIFISKGVTSVNGVKIVGNNHLKFRAYQSNFVIDAIAYGLVNKMHIVTSRKPFSIVYHIEENVFNGQATIQLKIKDILPENE
jgi:single-stranded-DNA-specific exonuclease